MGTNRFASLEWRCIGPHRGGRVVAVAGHPTERGTFYFGGCAGGVWKSTSGGSLWENISDGYFKTAAVGAITVSPSDPNVIYVGTGETAIRSNVSHGDGVYRSDDGGHTWRNLGLAATRHIGDIIVHPKNPDLVYVAALGHAWGRNSERGVYRSRDGGRSWQKVLYKSDRAGAIDLAMDPNQPNILYASLWQGQRHPHACISGGEDSGIWRSTDGGDTWTEITRHPGLPPDGLLGKIGLAASPAQAGRVWALVEHSTAGPLFRSDDYGATWQQVSDKADLKRRPWYYMHIFADPSDAETVWVLSMGCFKSTDGGRTFTDVPTPHGDNHGLWIDPTDSKRMIEGNDGGACVTYDGGRTWSSILNQPTAQFYHVTVDDQAPYHVYGSQQDNWAMRLPSIGFEGAISWKDYMEPGGGESGHIAVSPKPPHYVYGGGIGTGAGHGRLIRWNPQTRQTRNVTVWPEVNGFGAGAESLKYRFQWTFPVEVSAHDADTVYICSNFVHRSRDDGTSWETISPDLTRNDPEKIVPSGGPITYDNSGAEIYCTIFAFRESPHEAGVLWAGSDDGLLHLSRDAGQNWAKITPPDLPEWSQIMHLECSPHDQATAYLCATRYKLDDTRPFLYKTSDYGQNWTKIVGNLPDEEFTRVIREDPVQRGLLYAGTETGVWVSFDDGGRWERLETNLPVVPIHDLAIKDTDLVAATHGRSFWILDDITPLRQMAAAANPGGAVLYQPRPTTRHRHYGRAFQRMEGDYALYKMTGPVTVAYRLTEDTSGVKREAFLDAGKNPPDGVIVHYHLPEAPAEGQAVTLSFHAANGETLRSFTSQAKDPPRVPAKAGANRFLWNLRGEAPAKLEEQGKAGGDPFGESIDAGVAPKAVPGEYEVRLTIGDQTLSQRFQIVADPRLPASADDLAAQSRLKGEIRGLIDQVHTMLNQLRRVRRQVEGWEDRTKGGEHEAKLTEAAKAVKDKLGAIEGKLLNLDAGKPQPGPNQLREKLAAVSGMIDESDDAPTRGAIDFVAQVSGQIQSLRADLDRVLGDDVTAFNAAVGATGLSAVGV